MTPLLFMSFTMFGHTCLLSNLFARYLLVACNKVCMEYDSIVCCILCFTKKLKVRDYHQLINSPTRQIDGSLTIMRIYNIAYGR